MQSLLEAAATYLNTLGPREIVWIGIGFLGQFLFMMRFLWQWIQSERQRRSIIPIAFWYFSLAGGMTPLPTRSIGWTLCSSRASRSDCSCTPATCC
jgi:lipid-A-disaccharide synthase-like uncharacterized protein